MSGPNVYKRTIVKEEIHSKVLNETRSIRIFLPEHYNPMLEYPVIYCQDGEEFFNFGRIATHAAQLIYEEGIDPMIIVGADVYIPNRTAEYSPDGDRFDSYCRFFTEELIPYIEEEYAVKKDSSGRIAAGDSLGGTVSLHLALDHPHLFQQVIALSGAFYESTLNRIKKEKDLSWLKMYAIVGLDEEEVKTDHGTFNFVSLNREAKQLLTERGADLTYSEKPGKHLWGFWQKELPDALRLFFKHD